MKRLLLLGVLVLAATAIPAQAQAAAPCRDKIYNDWYHDGRIATTYPIACYRDALKHVGAQSQVYSSLIDDIHAALQAALERKRGKKVPAAVGKKLPPVQTSSTGPGSTGPGSKGTKTTPSTVINGTTTNGSGPGPLAGGGTGSSGGGGVPVPLIVLGAIAILLAAAGAVGIVVRRRGGGGGATPAP